MTEKRYGILIASSRFPEERNLDDLRFPENDVDAVDEILRSKEHGDFAETHVLKNARCHEVLLKINQVLRRVGKNDLVLIYYSGHGKLNPAGKLYLACKDTVLNALEATSVALETIRSYVDISDSNKIVLVLDCCFSGAAGAAFSRGGVEDQLQLASGGRGTYILTATTGIQVAVEEEADQYGIFTKHLVEGIKTGEADKDGDGNITMDELYRYVHEHVLEESAQEPMKWDLNVRGELVIAQSGKTLREKRNREIRQMLFELAKEDLLPDDILDKARHVLALDAAPLQGESKEYDDLLQQLYDQRIQAVEFARVWDKVSSGEPGPVKGKVPHSGPEPPPKPRKNTRLLITAAVLVISAIVAALLFWPSNQEKENLKLFLQSLNDQEIPSWERQFASMETTIAQASSAPELQRAVETLGALERDIVSVRDRLRNERTAAEEYGMIEEYTAGLSKVDALSTNMEKALGGLHNRLENVGRLYVDTVPPHARVRIMNIPEKFEQGIELPPGSYELEISADGYETQTHVVDLRHGGTPRFAFELTKVVGQPPLDKRGWLGIRIQDLTPEVREQFGVSDGEGAVIMGIIPGSSAERAHLKIGDIVKEIDGHKVRNASDLTLQVGTKEVGKRVALKISRSGKEMTVPVPVGELPGDMRSESDRASKDISPPPVAQHSAPKAPTDLRAAVAGKKEVRLEWTDNADNETGFKVMRRVGGENEFRNYATVGKNQNRYLDQHADRPGTDYQYVIQAFNDVGRSLHSNMASAKTPLTRPEAPADLRAQAVAPTQVKLVWRDRSGNERGFKIERRSGTEGFRVIQSVGPDQASLFDKDLRPGTKYEYRVRAFNDGGESSYSTSVSIRMANPTWATASGFLAVVKPGIQSVDDISGLRICGSQRNLDYLRNSTGEKYFKPITLSSAESYTALQTGVCEALVVFMDDPKKLHEFYYGMRYNEVTSHLILLP